MTLLQLNLSRHLPAQSNNRNTRARCEICSKLTMKMPEQRHWRCSGVLIVNFEHVIAGWDNRVNLDLMDQPKVVMYFVVCSGVS